MPAVKTKEPPSGLSEEKLTGRDPLAVIKAIEPERPVVVVDDKEYELRLLQEFGAAEHHRWTHKSAAYDDLWNQEELKKAELSRLERLLDELLDMALRKPDQLREDLGDLLTAVVKREIVLTFTTAPLLMAAQAQENGASQLTTES